MVNPTLARVLDRHGGIARMGEFLAAGNDIEWVRMSRGYGKILMIRKGWYCRPELAPEIIMAVRVGGRLGCVSALAHHGLGPVPDRVHIALPPGASRLRDPHDHRRRLGTHDGIVLHWSAEPLSGDRCAVGADEARAQAASCWATATTP